MSQISINMFSTAISRFTQVQVVLPNDSPIFITNGNKNYERQMKTLILLHGYSGNCNDWLSGSNIATLASKYNLAVVMPSGDNSFYLNAKASGNNYEDFIACELIEYLRKTFGIAKEPKDTFIGGLSMGGFGAIHTALHHPENFGKMFGLSSALIVNGIKNLKEETLVDGIANKEYYERTFGDLTKLDDSDNNPEYLIEKRLSKGETIQPIFMACGSEDFLIEKNREFRDYLIRKKVDVIYKETPGIHDWKFWNEYIEPAIIWGVEE